jgi:hypothetical protein
MSYGYIYDSIKRAMTDSIHQKREGEKTLKTVHFVHIFCIWHLVSIIKWSVFETSLARQIDRIKLTNFSHWQLQMLR